MAKSAKDRVRELLRERGPLSVDEIVAQVAADGSIESKKPKQTIRNALTNDHLCQSAGDGRYVYLPTFMQGARMRVPMQGAMLEKGILRVPGEAAVFLWPLQEYPVQGATATLHLAGGPDVEAQQEPWRAREPGLVGALSSYVRLPAPFWIWWQAQEETGADTLLLRCEDGETGRYSASTARSNTSKVDLIVERNAQARQAAEEILRPTRGQRLGDIGRRLLGRGLYHDEPPDPLIAVLLDPSGQIVVEGMYQLTFRPEMTPALRRLFADRLQEEEISELGRGLLRMLGFAARNVQQPVPDRSPYFDAPATATYRVKVSLEWNKRVWRVIEILDNQTLEDLHYAIQEAFGWDDDHLYAFYLSNQAYDSLTMIARRTEFDYDPPTTDEVTLSELDLKAGQRFLYIFDFGDDLRHNVEVLQIADPPTSDKYPRIVLKHGEAPPQYGEWDDQDELE